MRIREKEDRDLVSIPRNEGGSMGSWKHSDLCLKRDRPTAAERMRAPRALSMTEGVGTSGRGLADSTDQGSSWLHVESSYHLP